MTATYPIAAGGTETDPVASAALTAHIATDASDAELSSEASTRSSADTALDARVDVLEAGGRAFVGPDAPVSPPDTYLWVETGLAPAGAGFTFWIEDGS